MKAIQHWLEANEWGSEVAGLENDSDILHGFYEIYMCVNILLLLWALHTNQIYKKGEHFHLPLTYFLFQKKKCWNIQWHNSWVITVLYYIKGISGLQTKSTCFKNVFKGKREAKIILCRCVCLFSNEKGKGKKMKMQKKRLAEKSCSTTVSHLATIGNLIKVSILCPASNVSITLLWPATAA